MTPYKVIFFDWDGVITDSVDVKTEAYFDMFAEFGSEVQIKVKEHHLKNGGISRYEKFKLYYKNYLNINISEEKISELSDKFSLLVKDKVINSPFVDGAVETIMAEFTKGTKLFVVTGTPTCEIIEIAKAKEIFDYFVELCGSPTKKTEIVSNLISKYSLNPKNCLFIGDALADYEAAKANGMDFLGIVKYGIVNLFPEGTKISNKVGLIF